MSCTLTAKEPFYGPKRCPVYLRLPWKGNGISEIMARRIRRCVEPVYRCCAVRLSFSSKPMLPSSCKDHLPTHLTSNVIYRFECRCGLRYVGKTTQRLDTRIRQHVPNTLREKPTSGQKTKEKTKAKQDSAIAQHLLTNVQCLDAFDKSLFRIISKARTHTILHTLEALYIKHLKPELCKQLEFVKSLHLFP